MNSKKALQTDSCNTLNTKIISTVNRLKYKNKDVNNTVRRDSFVETYTRPSSLPEKYSIKKAEGPSCLIQ